LFSILGAAAIAASVAALPASLVAQQPYKIIAQWKIGGDGVWDYLHADPTANRLYISRQTHVDVVDTTTGKLVGKVGGMKFIHGIALDSAGKYGYVTDENGKAVVVFDRKSLAVVKAIDLGTGTPDSILFEPATKTVWAFDGPHHTAIVIDTASLNVVDTVALPGKPESAAFDGQGLLYDNIESKNEIVRIDARSRAITATWPAGCDSPSGIAMDIPGHRLFTVCHGNKMSVLDSETGKVLANPEIGQGPDGAGWSDKYQLAFTTTGDGNLSVVNAGAPDYPTIEKVPTPKGARTMSYDPVNDRIYTITGETIAPKGFENGPPPPPPHADEQQPGQQAGQQQGPPPGQQGPPPQGQDGQQGPPPPGQQPQSGQNRTPPPMPTVVPGSFTVVVIGR
jgi:DNA-binding beta-propeller fold protein YncE